LHATDNGPAPSQKNNASIGGGDEGEEEEDKEEKKEQSSATSTMLFSFFSSPSDEDANTNRARNRRQSATDFRSPISLFRSTPPESATSFSVTNILLSSSFENDFCAMLLFSAESHSVILVTKHPSNSFSADFESSSSSFPSPEEEEEEEEDFLFNTRGRSNNESCVATLTPRPFARPQMHACIDDDDGWGVLPPFLFFFFVRFLCFVCRESIPHNRVAWKKKKNHLERILFFSFV
jgi:hypothetical protein